MSRRSRDGIDPDEEGDRDRKDVDDESLGYNFFLVMFLDKISFFEKENDGILSELTDLVELRKSMGFSSSEMHALGKNFIVAGGEDSRFRELDVIIKCQTREILRQFPALRDKSILLEAISEAMITNMKIVTVEWFDQFKKSKIDSKSRSTNGEDRIWKYFERYQEIFFNVFGFMYFYLSTAMTLNALDNYHKLSTSSEEGILWPKKKSGTKEHLVLFGIKGWFACVNDIPICIQLKFSF